MNINVACPHCRTTLETPDTLVGNEVQCPACGKNFVVKIPSVPVGSAVTPPPVQDAGRPSSLICVAKSPVIMQCLLGVSLLLSVISLCIALSTSGFPKLKLETDPEKAVRSRLHFEAAVGELSGEYFWRKNGKKILDSLDIREIKINGSWAVAFYKLSLGATEVKDAMMLYKVNDGYWVKISPDDAKKKCPEKWYREMDDKADRFKRDSGKFDIYDI